MKQAFENNMLFIPETRSLPNTNDLLPFSIVEDEGFPLKTYLMRPYAKKNLQSNEQCSIIGCQEHVEPSKMLLAFLWHDGEYYKNL